MKKIPTHIAIIMDGNRRWAKKRKLPILAGHEIAAKKVLEKIVEHAAKIRVKFLTFWAFSTENWQRDKREVNGLLNLIRWSLKEKVKTFAERGVRLKVIGNTEKFPVDIKDGIEKAIEKTKNGKNITVVLAVNYGGRDEIVRTINKMYKDLYSRHSGESRQGRDDSRIKRNGFWTQLRQGYAGQASQNDGAVTEENLSQHLDTAGIPDPDLIIRTGGEKRLSGFLLWQSEYSELYFTDTLWPDFTPKDLDLAITDYQERERRFGK